MNAEIVAVGSEMLTPQKIDTNSLYLTDQLNSLGVEVVQKCVIGDDRNRLAAMVREAAARSGLVIVTGGLGPTEDDVTRDAVAAALGRAAHFDQAICDTIAERFRRFNRTMAEINKRQAYVIDGAEVLPNDRGTAPGQWVDAGSAIVVLLPGPPNELKAMWESQVMPRLQARLPVQVIRTKFYRVAGMTESDVDNTVAPVYTRYTNPACTILAAAGDIQLHLRARCDTCEQAEALLAEVGSQIEAALGERLYTRTGDALEACVGEMLASRSQTICVAESCTGGMLAERLTDVAGSSRYFPGGFVTYSNELKVKLLGVDEEVLEREGAVSETVAQAMAEGARKALGTDYALSVTGIAGPDGGTEEKPVGTVFIGLATPRGTHTKGIRLPGDRDRVRIFAVNAALDMLRLHLLRDNNRN
jgi:nicotinamide-nucleotide amidase